MYTFYENDAVRAAVRDFYEAGKPTAVICHGTCVLLKTRLSDGRLLVEGKTWTGFANSEEDYADEYVGKRIQPFRIEDEAKKLDGTNFIVSSRFKSHAVRDGLLITGQQQYSGAAAARLVIEALRV
jgi:putative intracellular protease/amidase